VRHLPFLVMLLQVKKLVSLLLAVLVLFVVPSSRRETHKFVDLFVFNSRHLWHLFHYSSQYRTVSTLYYKQSFIHCSKSYTSMYMYARNEHLSRSICECLLYEIHLFLCSELCVVQGDYTNVSAI